MIKVYWEMEQPRCAVLVAIFDSGDIYDACYKSLEIKCKESGWDFMTESVEEFTSFDDIQLTK